MSRSPLHSNYRMTVRVELENVPGQFARLASILAHEQANLGAVDIVDVSRERMVRDVTFDASSEEHAQRVIERLKADGAFRVVSASDPIFLLHLGGKIHMQSKVRLKTRNTLSMAYTPGVARVAQAIAKDRALVHTLTSKANSVAVVSDGSAILGLGNLGADAAMPVMEGKAMLFKEFADIDAWPICLATQRVDEIVRAVEMIAPTFGAINLEDISAPRCFEIERRLKASLDIPAMHDDQHGTAVVVLAALQNALHVVGKQLSGVRIIVNGMGAAGTAVCQILLAAGADHVWGCDRNGAVLHAEGEHLPAARADLRACTHFDQPFATLQEALNGADVFIGVSAANILTPADLKRMARDRIVFAMANPDPEIAPDVAAPLCRVLATGRSDYANQVNNVLAFPGIFRGALDVRAREINEPMKLAAARAIASAIPEDHLSEDYIIPSVFNKHVVQAVAKAVAKAAIETGVARRHLQTNGHGA
ncbi:MAG: NAD-dependent malic enzyme [Planctomycetes bacterium]|nr:NAD-dependent malic enzyme [Planctomycetota bacterium]